MHSKSNLTEDSSIDVVSENIPLKNVMNLICSSCNLQLKNKKNYNNKNNSFDLKKLFSEKISDLGKNRENFDHKLLKNCGFCNKMIPNTFIEHHLKACEKKKSILFNSKEKIIPFLNDKEKYKIYKKKPLTNFIQNNELILHDNNEDEKIDDIDLKLENSNEESKEKIKTFESPLNKKFWSDEDEEEEEEKEFCIDKKIQNSDFNIFFDKKKYFLKESSKNDGNFLKNGKNKKYK